MYILRTYQFRCDALFPEVVAGETVESGTLEHHAFCLLLLPVADILDHSVAEHPSAHLHGLLPFHAAVECFEAVGKEAVHHGVPTEAVVEPLESVEAMTSLYGVLQVGDNVGVHGGGWEVGSLVFVGKSDAVSPGQASVWRWNWHPGGCVVSSDAVSAGAPVGAQRNWSWRGRGGTPAVSCSVEIFGEIHLESKPCSAHATCRPAAYLPATSGLIGATSLSKRFWWCDCTHSQWSLGSLQWKMKLCLNHNIIQSQYKSSVHS